MNNRILFIIICLLLFTTANAQPRKNKMKKYGATPEWVTAKPQEGDYYIGISSAAKKGKTPEAYMAAARQNALADLAAAITTKIETSSTLYTLETTQQYGYNFSNDIRATSNVDLEGYELMGSWEDANYYWVYYRLSRSAYAARRAEKKRTAITAAKEKLTEGDRLMATGAAYNAFMSYCDGLALLKPYLGESTRTTMPDNTESDLGIHLVSKLTDFVNSASFLLPASDVIVKRGAEIMPETLTFKLVGKDGTGLGNMPIRIELTTTGLRNPNIRTDGDGKFTCPIRKLKSMNEREHMFLQLDMNALAYNISDETMREIVRNIIAPRKEVGILFRNPSIAIRANDPRIEMAARGAMTTIFEINHQTQDFELIIDKDITFQEHDGTLFALVIANIVVKNSKNEIVFRKKFQKDINGSDRQEMEDKGIEEICRTVERTLKHEIANNIF